MDNLVKFDKEKYIILLYDAKLRKFVDRTNNIKMLYKVFYYGNFSGYNIYFKNSKGYFTYTKEKVHILKLIKNIPLDNRKIILNNNIIQVNKIEKFEQNYFRITMDYETIVTKGLRFVNPNIDKFDFYFKSLAHYATNVTKLDEPLHILANNIKNSRIKYNSCYYNFLTKTFKREKDNNVIILPFAFNKSQYQAITSALNNNVSIIEGPPGTGKTQTILNLMANLIIRNKTCAVISNNNAAIENVYLKLKEHNLSIFAASLGSRLNVKDFFDEKKESLNDFILKKYSVGLEESKKNINKLYYEIKEIYEAEEHIAKLEEEKNTLFVEMKNHNKGDLTIKKNNSKVLDAKVYLNIIHLFEKKDKLNFFDRLRLRFKYKIIDYKKDVNIIIKQLESLFYIQREKEINIQLDKVQCFLNQKNKDIKFSEINNLSKNILINHLSERYEKMLNIEFNEENFKKQFTYFIKRYPAILSTSYSVTNNIPEDFLFDYLIIDEASQSDLLSSILAMNCAKNLVIVGDSRQLQYIEEERLITKSQELAENYKIDIPYRYDKNSIIQSIRTVFNNAPITLLKEHYRCALDIINFCNKMFYNNELIVMTKNKNTHIEIIKTVPGNHARRNPTGSGLYNQREIDEIAQIIKNNNYGSVGIISPFRYQANMIQEQLSDLNIEAETIHKFQGREKDTIILSFVLNSLEKNEIIIENKLYDFLTNEKLLNVAVSRAKNKIIAIISDKIYFSKNNIIKDFINYAEYLYGDMITKEASTKSVFDYLYSEYKDILIKKFKNNKKDYFSELLMIELIDSILINYPKTSYQIHTRLSTIVNDVSFLNDTEKKYIMHPQTHVDFLFYNNITKEKLFILEIDGIKYHEQNKQQAERDKLKDRTIKLNKLDVYRFKTNESKEKERLIKILDLYQY